MQLRKNQDQRGGHKGAAANRSASLRSRRRAWMPMAACFIALAVLAGGAQSGQQASPSGASADHAVSTRPEANGQNQAGDRQTGPQNGQTESAGRRKEIADDSAKLLKLATDLKTEVDKTNKDILSIKVIRQADEIEHLAHNVKEKTRPAGEPAD